RRLSVRSRPLPRTRRAGAIALSTIAALTLCAAAGISGGAQDRSPHRALIIVVDGLRPDYVTPEAMPRLVRLGQRGTVFTAHHSVVPTVTRVNGSSLVTGAYPETHGILGN